MLSECFGASEQVCLSSYMYMFRIIQILINLTYDKTLTLNKNALSTAREIRLVCVLVFECSPCYSTDVD